MRHTARKTLPLLLLGLLASACGRFDGSELDVQTFTLEFRSGYEAAELIAPYVFDDRPDRPGEISATGEAITVRETKDNLDRITRVLQEFDEPFPAARLRFQLIEADSFQDEDPAIAEVVEELRDLFRFEGYRLLGEAVVAVGGGSSDFRQPFYGTRGDLPEPFFVSGEADYRGQETIRLNHISVRTEEGTLLETSVNASISKTLVMGGSEARGTGRTLILTVTAEVD